MGRTLTRVLLPITAIAGLGFGVWNLTRPQPVEVALHRVTKGQVRASVANTRAGTVKPCRRARLSPASGGQMARLDVREGRRVEAGEVLLALWNDDLEAELALSRSEASAAEAQAREACLKADVAEREANRLVRLQGRKLVSEDEVDQAVTRAAAGRAACQAARAKGRVAEDRILVSQAALDRTVLLAPFAGIVAEVTGEVGEYVTPSPPGIPTPPAVDLIDDACFYVSAPIDEVDAPRVAVDQPVTITLDAFPDTEFPGRVRRIAPYVLDFEKQARTVEVEVDFTTPTGPAGLLAGYSADVEIVLETREAVLWVPSDALLDEDYVLVYPTGEAMQHLEKRRVQTGIANWEATEVVSGLAAGDRIVTSVGREGVEDGALAQPEADTE